MTEPMGERGRQGAAPLGGHTPGPWTVQNEDLSDPWNDTAWVTAGDHKLMANELNPADARLIAAAPELLEALRVEHGIEDGVHHEPPCSVCDLDYRIMGEQ